MNYYLISSEEGFNEIRFKNVRDWQKYMGINKSIKQDWQAPILEYIEEENTLDKFFDISQVCNPLFTFSDKAVNVLKDELLKYGEFLEIEKPKGFHFFHCTYIINPLIEGKSKLVWLDKNRGWLSRINKFVFDENKIKHNPLVFRIPQADYSYTFFSEKFKNIIEKNNLKGINFSRFENDLIEKLS